MFSVKPDVAPIFPIGVDELRNGFISSDPFVGIGAQEHDILISGKKFPHKYCHLFCISVRVPNLEGLKQQRATLPQGIFGSADGI